MSERDIRNAALEEAAQIVLDSNVECPCCGTRDLPHTPDCTFENDCPWAAEEWARWPKGAAEIRALKEVEDA